ncbi:MAG: class I SAM-dependent methyltransferase [Rhodospirillales bacterium]
MTTEKHPPRHLRMTEPAEWFRTYRPLIAEGGNVLDVAAGGGRHVKLFADAGHNVTAVDRNTEALSIFADTHDTEIIEADLEDGSPWPLPDRTFDAVCVCNYLYRPLFDDLIGALAPGGVLLYETFALGNEVYAKPRNPDHLLKSGELLDLVRGRLQVIAYRHGIVEGDECPGVKQMICAVNNLQLSDREDGDPAPRPLP